MIEVQLTELDLELETTQLPDFTIDMEHSSEGVALQGPIDFGMPEPEGMKNWGYIDLDLLGFPYHGLSAYEVAVKNGFVGTEAEWLASLKGEDGELGQAGKDAVARAEAAAENAAGSANAASGFKNDAYAYSGVAGQHATASAEIFAQSQAVRDETGRYAEAVAGMKLETEVSLTDAKEQARAAQISRVAAETSQAKAEASERRTAHSESSAAGSAASASESSQLTVEARDEAIRRSDAAILAESEVRATANEVRNDANAARKAQLIATAARDEAKVTAQGVVVSVEQAKTWATDAEAHAEASRQQRLAADAARQGAETAAGAAYLSEQSAKAHSSDAKTEAEAAAREKLSAQTASNQAAIERQAAVQAAQDANGYRVGAKDYYDLTVQQNTQAGQSAAAAVTARNEARLYADQSGQLYGGLAQRVDGVELRIGNVEGSVTALSQAVATAEGKVNTMYSLRLNSNGHIIGYVFQNNGTTGSMTITTNTFSLVDPNGGTPRTPFQMDGNVLTLTGEVRVNGSLILNGTIVGQNAIVKDTVMPIVSNYVAGKLTINTTGYTTVAEITVQTTGSQVQVEFNGLMFFTHEPSGSFDLEVQLRRSGGGQTDLQIISETVFGAGNTADNFIGKWPIKVLDRPPAGTIKYYVNVRTSASNMTIRDVFNRFMSVMEYRTNA